MTDFNQDNCQTQPYLQDNPIPELSPSSTRSASLNQAEVTTSQPQGSLLLDSINAYLINSQSNFQTIKEVNETDEYDPQRHLQINQPQNLLDRSIQRQMMRKEITQFCNGLNDYHSKQTVIESLRSTTKFLKLTNLHQPTNFTLDFSHYKNKIDQSITKTDPNSSLIVEISNQKQPNHLNQEVVPVNSPFQANLELPPIIAINLSQENNQNKEGKASYPSLIHKDLLPQSNIEEQRHFQAISNQSIDSNLILALIPFECIAQEKPHSTHSHHENNQEMVIEHHDVASGKMEEYMQIEPIPHQAQDIPMDVENNFENRPQIYNQHEQIPMQIESMGFPATHDLTIIAIDPIKEQMNPPEQQERVEEQEILDCITTTVPAEQLYEKQALKEFTFGKVECEVNTVGKMKEEMQKSIPPIDYQSQQHPIEIIPHVQLSTNQINNLSNQSSVCIQANNLSLNVEHQNNFSEVLREIQEMPPFNSLKNEMNANEMTQNEPILTSLQCETNPNEQIVYNYNPTLQAAPSSQKNEEKNIEQEVDVAVQDNDRPQQSCRYTVIINSVDNKTNEIPDKNAENPKIKRLQQGIVVNQTIFPCHQPVTCIDKDEKNDNNKFKLSYNNVCNYSLGNQYIPHYSPKTFQKQRPQIVIHNDNYHLSNETQRAEASHFVDKSAAPQQNHLQQQNMQMYPCINVNFRNNQMSVSIVGPAIAFQNQPSANKNHSSPLKQNHTPEQISFQSVNQSSSLKATKSFIESSLQENNQSIEQPTNQKAEKQPQKQKSSQKQQSKFSRQSLEQQMNEISSFNERYHYIINEAQNYLLEYNNSSQIIHRQFELLVNLNVYLRFTPQPKTQLGIQLFKNGLFLIALVKLVTRSSQSPFIICYIYEYLEGAYGHLIEKNSYVFKNQYERARKNYQGALEKKFTEMMLAQKEQVRREEPMKRRNITENCFMTQKFNTKDSYSQVSPKKVNLIEEVIQTQPNLLIPFVQKSLEPIPISSSKYKKNIDKKSSISNEETIQIIAKPTSPKPQITPIKKSNEKSSPKKIQDLTKSSKKKEIPQAETSSEQVAKADYKSSELKLKKSIEQIRNSLGSSGKKNDTQDVNSDQASKFSELYLKYRKIRQNKKSDLPIQNSSVKRSIVEQALKADSQEPVPQKKPTKKVVFTDEVVINNPIENEESNQEDFGKRRRKKRSRSKKDDSVQKSEQQDNQTTFKKKINSKK